MRAILNNTTSWIYISTFNLKPAAIMPLSILETELGDEAKAVVNATEGLVIVFVPNIDNSKIAMKQRLNKIKKGERWDDV